MKKSLRLLAVLLAFLHEISATQLQLNGEIRDNQLPANIGSPALLTCEVVNNTNAETLMWYRGTQQVDVKAENNVNVSHVCIPNVTSEDNGVSFTCLLKSDTSVKLSMQLNVPFNPVLSGDTIINGEESKTVQIICGFKANPAAAMFWRKNEKLFTLPDHYKQDMTTDSLHLTIEKVTKKDSANYTCVALSNGTETTRVFELIVADRKEELPVEAIAAAVVVGALIIAFAIFARRDKIFRCKKAEDETAM
ncbi:transmembrane and immunoglobulin domain-containing protein 1 [Bufo gargarizans]|uniref:transmembrane and immunoglobulin domain-containing protein 1 n=1 Tax=Bufo gargarizans TaxID=30331 RepID=UPI001CF44FF7|nr:transmembrane and immunoglobulin domain-containing protein 1 [Bufo gargarizans]